MKKQLFILIPLFTLVGCNTAQPAKPVNSKEISEQEFKAIADNVQIHKYSKLELKFTYSASSEEGETSYSTIDKFERQNDEWVLIEGTYTPADFDNTLTMNGRLLEATMFYGLELCDEVVWKYYKDPLSFTLFTKEYDSEDNTTFTSLDEVLFNEIGYCTKETLKYETIEIESYSEYTYEYTWTD